jgi:ABC-type dipeptide/oligopeptide/nickel transport system permease subunit
MSADVEVILASEAAIGVADEAQGQLTIFWKRFRRHKLAVISAVVLIIIFLIAIFAPVLAPYDPNLQDRQLARFGQPAPPSMSHPFGSDHLGRDLLSRIMHGARISLVVGFVATGTAIMFGAIMGAIAGYTGRWVDMVIMRLSDVMLAFPPLLFLMAMLASVTRPGILHISMAVAVIGWMNVARLVRGEFLVLRTREYTEAARAVGASAPSIIFRELLPNAIGPIIVAATLGIPAAILTESTLSFLGFGIQPPRASWGNMLQDSFVYMRDFNAWWMGVFPGLMIGLTVLSFNFLGDGLRDALDPRSRID